MLRRITLVALSCLAVVASAQQRIQDVVYLKSGGAAFTMDVFKPATPNKAAVVWMVSGGWFSSHDSLDPNVAKVFTDQGFTVFEVVHGSQPRYKIPEIVQQVRRAVRFIHANAAEYGIDPKKLGVTGFSAGGHLSLMIGALGDDGDPNAKDPIDRASSKVATVVEMAGPTDFLNWGKANFMPFDDPKMEPYIPAFGVDPKGPKDAIDAAAKATSPITYVTASFPPILLVHGDADALVPLQQAKELDATLTKLGVEHKLSIVEGGGHDGKSWNAGVARALEWFKARLAS